MNACGCVFITFVSVLTSQALPFVLGTNRKSLGSLPGEKRNGICTHTHTLIDAGFMRTLVHTQILTAVLFLQSLTHARAYTYTQSIYKLLLKSLKFNRETGCPQRENEKKTTALKKATELMKTNYVQVYSCTETKHMLKMAFLQILYTSVWREL